MTFFFQNMETSEPSDPELLADWFGRRREPAFHALVARYAGLVHATARRTCGDDSMAAEATQLTFIALAQKARSLASCASLGGWLHTTARMQALNLSRKAQRENRKRQLLQTAMETESPHTSADVWQEMQPVLDEALASLSEKDRETLLLRFYRSLTIREIAATLGITTDAAQKRIDRATERLRGKLLRRGVQTGGSLSAAMLAGFAADAQASVLSVSVIASKAIAAGAVSSFSLSAIITSIAAVMKSSSLIPPAVALILAGAWTGTKYQALSAEERMNASLRAQLDAVGSMDPATTSTSKFIGGDGAVDWKKLVEDLLQQANSDGKSRAIRLFEAHWESLDSREMASKLQEIDTLDLSADELKALEKFLMDSLVKKDPGLGLSWVVAHHPDGDGSSDYDTTFRLWAMKDLSGATEWLDREIAAGSFRSLSLDGTNEARSKFEQVLIELLIETDPAAVSNRLAAMPEEQRLTAMRDSWLDALFTRDPTGYVKLIRQYLPPQGQLETFSWQAARLLANGDYPGATEYLNLIQATPEERTFCAGKAAEHKFNRMKADRPVTREDLDALREWVGSQAPAAVDDITGNVLATIAATAYLQGQSTYYDSKTGFGEAAALAAHYHEVSGNDVILINFLKTFGASRNKEQARVLAERISDETLRAKALKNFR
jgi:RNA polymerase sigma factor (sigma-70 family)